MATLKVYHSGIMLFADAKTRALLPDVRCGHPVGGKAHGHDHNHDHPQPRKPFLHQRGVQTQPGGCCDIASSAHDVEPHFPHIRIPFDHITGTTGDFRAIDFEGIDPFTGRLRKYALILLHREAISVRGTIPSAALEYDPKLPLGEIPATNEESLYYWVSNPTRSAQDADLSIRPEYLDDDPQSGLAAYFDMRFGSLKPFFGKERVSAWSFRPRSRGNKDHTQALAQVVVKSLVIHSPQLVFRTFGESRERTIDLIGGSNSETEVEVFVGNTTRSNMMLRPTGVSKSPDHHYDVYYDYLCPVQTVRPLPFLAYPRMGPPELQGTNCPPVDPPPPPPPPP